MQVFPPSFRDLWKEWDARVTVVLSLILQLILVILGHRRKYKQSLLIRAVVWSAYLAADSIAIFALGIISSDLTDIYYGEARSLDANTELTAFWAPFLLLHLGGPDTITAFSMADNELWLRHLFGLIVQTIITFYVFFLAWTGSPLSILFILMFFAGLIKYGERTYMLRSASDEKLRESIFTPQFGLRDADMFRREMEIKTKVGYFITRTYVVPDNQLLVDLSVFTNNKFLSIDDKLLTANGFLDLTKRFTLDILLSARERDRSFSVFRNMSAENAFEVVETELGLIYDLLYTKARLFCTPWGLALRGFTFAIICSVLVAFAFLSHKNRYSKIDLTITFLLLITPVIVDVYSALLFLFSDQFFIWLSKHHRSYILQALSSLPLSKKRWSHQMSEWSLLRPFISDKPLPCLPIFKLLTIDKKLEKRRHEAFKVSRDIKNLIFRCIKNMAFEDVRRDVETTLGPFVVIPTARGQGHTYRYSHIHGLDGDNILFWHIVTEVSYRLDKGKQQFGGIAEHCKLIKHISRYMGYLLLKYPSLLSFGEDKIALHKTIDLAIDELRRVADKVRKEVKDSDRKKMETCEKLVKSEAPVQESSRGWNKLLYDALKLADSRKDEEDLTKKWNEFGCIWLEMLFVAARRSSGTEHTQLLIRGGEFFTHVWLLFAHFGLTSHCEDLGIQDRSGNGNGNENILRVIAK